MFTVRLPLYDNQTWTINRSRFTSTFPESIITTALNDQDVTTIELTQPVVTPGIMNLIQVISDSKTSSPSPTIFSIPRDEPLSEAGQYLNMPLLEVMSNPLYDKIQKLLPFSRKNPTVYRGLIRWADENNYPELLRYVLSRRDVTLMSTVDSQLLHGAIEEGNRQLLTELLRGGIDPTTAKPYPVSVEVFDPWFEYGIKPQPQQHRPISPDQKFIDLGFQTLWTAIVSYQPVALQVLLKYVNISSDTTGELVHLALHNPAGPHYLNDDMAKILISDPNFTITEPYYSELFDYFMGDEEAELTQMLTAVGTRLGLTRIHLDPISEEELLSD